MGRVIYYTAVSLDGYVADAAGSLDWLTRHEHDPDGPLGWNAFDARIGAMVMGRATYDWATADLRRTGSGWPHRQPCWVLTSRSLPKAPAGADVRATQRRAPDVVAEMRAAAGDADLWCVGGGRTAGWLLAAGLLDEIWVTVAPEILGGGTPVLDGRAELDLLDVDRNGPFVTARYGVVRAD